MFAIAVFVTIILQVAITLSRNLLTRVYDDWGAELPFPTQIAFSNWPFALGSLLFVLTFAKELFVKDETSSRFWNALVCLVAVLFGIVYAIAALLPFVQPTMHGLS